MLQSPPVWGTQHRCLVLRLVSEGKSEISKGSSCQPPSAFHGLGETALLLPQGRGCCRASCGPCCYLLYLATGSVSHPSPWAPATAAHTTAPRPPSGAVARRGSALLCWRQAANQQHREKQNAPGDIAWQSPGEEARRGHVRGHGATAARGAQCEPGGLVSPYPKMLLHLQQGCPLGNLLIWQRCVWGASALLASASPPRPLCTWCLLVSPASRVPGGHGWVGKGVMVGG